MKEGESDDELTPYEKWMYHKENARLRVSLGHTTEGTGETVNPMLSGTKGGEEEDKKKDEDDDDVKIDRLENGGDRDGAMPALHDTYKADKDEEDLDLFFSPLHDSPLSDGEATDKESVGGDEATSAVAVAVAVAEADDDDDDDASVTSARGFRLSTSAIYKERASTANPDFTDNPLASKYPPTSPTGSAAAARPSASMKKEEVEKEVEPRKMSIASKRGAARRNSRIEGMIRAKASKEAHSDL